MKRCTLVLTVVMTFCLAFGATVAAGEVSEQLKKSVDQIIVLLTDPVLKAPDKKLERRNAIFKVVEDRFDFREMAQRSLGPYWRNITEAQQTEFEVAFSGLLENSYVTKIEKYTNERVNYVSEKPKGDYYFVNTEILSAGRSIPVNYSLHKVADQWLVYDVNIEGVSLVTNYRSQFMETMRKENFQGLMKVLNEKLARLEQ